MQKSFGKILYSASDIVNFLECQHLTFLEFFNLESILPPAEEDEEAKLIQSKGYAHEVRFVEFLKSHYSSFIDISLSSRPIEKVSATRIAMEEGVEIIYQAFLQDGDFIGQADFLRKVSTPSALGDYSYEVLDIKLSRTTRAKFLIQLEFYSRLLASIQDKEPLLMHVILGDMKEATYRCADYSHYLNHIIERFLAQVKKNNVETYPEPCEKCDHCQWLKLCEERRLKDDHLCQVANITRSQTRKLQSAGVSTLAALASVPLETRIPKINLDTLDKLKHQAALQLKKRISGENQLELLPQEEGAMRGFARLPRPDPGDLFFDIEGDPLEDGGLEYLFGLYFFQDGKPSFRSYWAHNRAEEKKAFEALMDFICCWLRDHPNAHVYHYAAYEETV